MLQRSWKHLTRYIRAIQNNFRIVSYNILSDSALFNNGSLYKSCYPNHLLWNHRLPRILDDIFVHDPDIICLQEVTNYHYVQCLQPTFNKMNFKGVYKQKNDPKADGCAIFYNNETFEMEDYYGIDITPVLPMNWRTQTALCVIFTPRLAHSSTSTDCNRSLAVVVTHLKYSPDNDFYRYIQTEFLLNEIKKLQQQGFINEIPIVLCGDFNSLADSLPIKLILNQTSPQSHIVTSSCGDRNPSQSSTYISCNTSTATSVSTKHRTIKTNSSLEMFDFNFKSAIPLLECITCDKNTPNNNSNYFTTCVNQQNASVVDYMFYHNPMSEDIDGNTDPLLSETSIEPCGFLELPYSNKPENVCLPNEFHGSDHLPIVVDFRFVSSYNSTAVNV